MIKKISRPKQVNNQDKQAPKTIQELMQRYDLDNKEVCDYLDYLIEHLIQEKQELNKKIETNTDNINNKVSKTGDTMTGDLILYNSHYIKGISNNGTILTLIRAYDVGDNIVAIGDARAEARIWSKSKPTIKYPDGTIETIATREQKILWQGSLYMNASQTAQLSEKISEQNNGIVLLFQPYRNGSPQPWGLYTHFFPKGIIQFMGEGYGQTLTIPDSDYGIQAGKYIYFYDDKLVGNDANIAVKNMFGTNIDNKNVVLTAVIGV